MPLEQQSALVSTQWLADHLSAPDVQIVDASWYLPQDKRDTKAEYEEEHIPGAVFFDIDAVSDPDTDLPHMLPSPELFSSHARKLGLGDGNRIVIYDSCGLFSAPRVWWMFRIFGHHDVVVLNGGLPKWLAEERPTEDRIAPPRERHFTSRLDSTMVRDAGQMRLNIEQPREVVIDARSPARFAGREPEPRAGVRPGHIPGSRNLHYKNLINPDDQTLLPADQLLAAFDAIGVTPGEAITTSCGSGISAAILALALHETGARNVALYDGSWAEWGGLQDCPIETG